MSCCSRPCHVSATTAPAKPASPKSGCGCERGCGCEGECCDLLCFERPNNFCGHLLTDADLLCEQRYFREKNKLYHRALHGHGIVCGLRIMCDSDCEGYVRIEEGYAIDDCGNDLVVCEPLRFDVLKPPCGTKAGWSRRRRPIPAHRRQQGRLPHTAVLPDRCLLPEEMSDFTAPLTPGCNPKPVGVRAYTGPRAGDLRRARELPDKGSPFAAAKERDRGVLRVVQQGTLRLSTSNGNADPISSILSGDGRRPN